MAGKKGKNKSKGGKKGEKWADTRWRCERLDSV